MRDTIIVSCKESGFNNVFLNKRCWYPVSIDKKQIKEIKYIAAYQVSPISAITHYAEVKIISQYQGGKKKIITFKGQAIKLKRKIVLGSKNTQPQARLYGNFSDIQNAADTDNVFVPNIKSFKHLYKLCYDIIKDGKPPKNVPTAAGTFNMSVPNGHMQFAKKLPNPKRVSEYDAKILTALYMLSSHSSWGLEGYCAWKYKGKSPGLLVRTFHVNRNNISNKTKSRVAKKFAPHLVK